jgi:hypothetical protein
LDMFGLTQFYFSFPTKPYKPSTLLETRRQHCAQSAQ